MSIEAEYYDHHAGAASIQIGNASERERAEKIADFLPSDATSVLDVGCGCGMAMDAIARRRAGLKLVGLERSEKTAEEARALFGLEVVHGSADDLPFEDDAFEVVMANELLEHLPWSAFERTLAELARVARRTIIITTPFNERRQFVTCPECRCQFSPFYHVRSFSDARLGALFAGFERTQQELIWVRGRAPLVYEARRLKAAMGFVPPLPSHTICPQCGLRNQDAVRDPRSAPSSTEPTSARRRLASMFFKAWGVIPRPRRAKWALIRYEAK